MLFRSSRYHRLAVLVLSSVLLTLAPLSEGQNANILVCPEDVEVVLDSDGNLNYNSLPPTTPPDREEYSPQGLAGWYDLARGFVNTVQSENLPYGKHDLSIHVHLVLCMHEYELRYRVTP